MSKIRNKEESDQNKLKHVVETVYYNGGSIFPAGYVPKDLIKDGIINAKQYYALQMLLNPSEEGQNPSEEGQTHGRVVVWVPGHGDIPPVLTILDLTPVPENISYDRVLGTIMTHSRKINEHGGIVVPKPPEKVKEEGEAILDVMTRPDSKYSEKAVDSMKEGLDYTLYAYNISRAKYLESAMNDRGNNM